MQLADIPEGFAVQFPVNITRKEEDLKTQAVTLGFEVGLGDERPAFKGDVMISREVFEDNSMSDVITYLGDTIARDLSELATVGLETEAAE